MVVKEKMLLTNNSHLRKMTQDQKTSQDMKKVTEQVYYYTLVSSGNTTEFSDYVDMQEERSFLAYRKIVERWSSVFGKDKIEVRLFDKQAFYENDLLADFAHVAGFDMTGLKKVKSENLSSLDSASIEFLRLLNGYCPKTEGNLRLNVDRSVLRRVFVKALKKNEKSYHLSRTDAQKILDAHRENNNWIAREYMGKEKLFSEDVSMYPEEVDSPHHLTVERCAELTASLWKTSGNLSFMLERLARNICSNCWRGFKK